MANLKKLPDDELLRLLSQDDHAAFTEIYNRYFPLLYAHIYKKLQDSGQAKDVVQEVFTRLWFKRQSAIDIVTIPGYLITSARNKIFDLFAHEKVKLKHYEALQEFFSLNPIVSTDYHVREAQFKAYIEQQLAALPPKMRVIFEMSRNENLTHKEIADKLETSANNVSTQITAALKILRTKLGLFTIILALLRGLW